MKKIRELNFYFSDLSLLFDIQVVLQNKYALSMLMIFFVSLIGILVAIFNHSVFLYAMFALEIVYLTTVANCVLLATTWPDSTGLIFALAALVVAACESAVGLGTLVVLYRFDKTIEYGGFETLRG